MTNKNKTRLKAVATMLSIFGAIVVACMYPEHCFLVVTGALIGLFLAIIYNVLYDCFE